MDMWYRFFYWPGAPGVSQPTVPSLFHSTVQTLKTHSLASSFLHPPLNPVMVAVSTFLPAFQ